MRIDIISACPELLESPLNHSIIQRAKTKGLCEIYVHNLRDWTLDPGFGFAKTTGQNDELLRGLSRLLRHGRPILVGLSRKSMVYKRFGISPEEALPATQVVQLRALQEGADILRVHDVAEARRTVALYRALSC